jgi:hypothetical protein
MLTANDLPGMKRRRSILTSLFKCIILIALLFSFTANTHSQTKEAKDDRWKYVCYDINDVSTKYYYDSETVNYISTNQVDVYLKIVSPKKQQILLLEIACASNMFHLIESPFDKLGPFDTPGKRVKTVYIAGKWRIIPPDSEVYLLSKLICK